MSYLQHPGRVLGEKEPPSERLFHYVAAQVGIIPDAWTLYAARDETRREHLAELLPRLGLEQFATGHYRALAAWLKPAALQTTRGIALARAVVKELRTRHIVLPSVTVIERLCAEAATRAQRTVFALLAEGLDTNRRIKLDQLLELREGSPYSILAWLRAPPELETARAILERGKDAG